MSMLTNGPGQRPLSEIECYFMGRDAKGRKCSGNIHEYDVQMVAKLDGTPVTDAPKEKTYICEGHYPDPSDPKFLLCVCRLCKDRKGRN